LHEVLSGHATVVVSGYRTPVREAVRGAVPIISGAVGNNVRDGIKSPRDC